VPSDAAGGRPGSRRLRSVPVIAMLFACAMISCGRPGGMPSDESVEYTDGAAPLTTVALRFAPVLFLHPDEPYQVATVFVVFHPTKPLIAYHIFFEDDVFMAGRGKSLDHEVAWVEFDPVTLKVTDVFTLWHRTVLRTESCLMDAKASGQRSKIEVEWGQHGLLPFGWKSLVTARPRLELAMHYEVVRYINRLPKASSMKPAVSFKGSFNDYLVFTEKVDAADYIHERDIVKAEQSLEFLRSRLGTTFVPKKEWPNW
jgi:hypothetical protein